MDGDAQLMLGWVHGGLRMREPDIAVAITWWVALAGTAAVWAAIFYAISIAIKYIIP